LADISEELTADDGGSMPEVSQIQQFLKFGNACFVECWMKKEHDL
jgi:hypothetical protein